MLHIENKNKKAYLLVSIFVLIIITISASYAVFRYSRTGSTNTLTSGYIEFSMLDGESVTITEEFPESDTEGNKNVPYRFTVNNNSSEGFIVYYNIGLVTNNNDSSKKYFTNDQIKYSLVKDGEYVVGTSDSGKFVSDSVGLAEGTSTGEGVILSNQAITAKKTDNFELRIWISDTVDYSNIIDNEGLSVGYFNEFEYSVKVKINAQSHAFAYNEDEEELGEGYIRLTLYYPSNAIEKKWRLDTGNIRTGENGDDWQDYTGPIVVKTSDVSNIYISYKVGGKTVIIPPTGKALVDINPASFSIPEGYITSVVINYDENAILRQYSIDGGAWTDYTGEFFVAPNTLIEAKVVKNENTYDSEGNLVSTNKITNYDSVYIKKYVPSSGGGSGSSGGSSYNPPSGVYHYGSSGSPSRYYGGGTSSLPSVPNYSLMGPDISVSDTSVVESTTVSINVNDTTAMNLKNNNISSLKLLSNINNQSLLKVATKERQIFYKIKGGTWTTYTGPFDIDYNTTIYSYYIDTDGTYSEVTKKVIDNIKKKNRPYLKGNVTYNNDKATVTFTGSDYDTLEYSLDDFYYQTYNDPITLDYNTVVYARATNIYGSTFVNINVEIPDKIRKLDNLNIGIVSSVDKDSLNGGITGSTEISINYDSRATTRLYKIGSGNWQEYKGSFELKENTTIYAYATSENGVGSAKKIIDFLTLGINDPIFYPSVYNDTKASSVNITIEFDPTSSVKQYSINGGEFIDYKKPFKIEENSVIEAYSENELGYKSRSVYKVTNIVKEPDFVILERKAYFLIKLNYPSSSDPATREYKFMDKAWTSYKSDGILLVKPEYKDEVLKNPDRIKIINETGKEVIFKGDYYLLDIPLSKLYENLLMRWDTDKPDAPTFIKSTTDPTKSLKVTINYDDTSIKKLYKVITPDGKDSGWITYESSIGVYQKGTVIFAKSMNRAEVWSNASNISIDNIDLVAPSIALDGDFVNPKRVVNINVNAKDDQRLGEIYYIKGYLGKESVVNNGRRIANGSVIQITENGKYTFLVEDFAGNYKIRYIDINNVDLTAPNLYITSLTDGFGTEAQYKIEFGDSVTKQYKIGANGTWKNYTDVITIKSSDVYALANDDFSITISAKGIDSAGNEAIVDETFKNIDLDMPKTPVITSTSTYPILTEYGVELELYAHIAYESRNDTINYYSEDNGTTWKVYTKKFTPTGTSVKAKSVKKNSGLESVTVSKAVGVPSDALGATAYDNDNSTYAHLYNGANRKIYIDKTMWEQRVDIYGYFAEILGSSGNGVHHITYFDENDAVISTQYMKIDRKTTTFTSTIPEGSSYGRIYASKFDNRFYLNISEITVNTTPITSEEKNYPLYTLDGVIVQSNITIKYHSTAIKKLYKIGNGEEWKTYNGAINVKVGDTIYAKSIDKYGNESPIKSLIPTLKDGSLQLVAYDGLDSTGYTYRSKGDYNRFDISKELWGKKLYYLARRKDINNQGVKFFDSEGNLLKSVWNIGASLAYYNTDIPENTSYCMFNSLDSYGYVIHEVKVKDE